MVRVSVDFMKKNSPLENSDTGSGAGIYSVVGIGASAGGLEALERFFVKIPADSGLCFVVVPHLDPHHHSLMAEVLSKHARIPVSQVTQITAVEPDHVYITPPNHYLSIEKNRLRLTPATEQYGIRMAIDHFFKSLAEDQGEKAVGIILSGTGSDGAQGIRDIKAHDGVTFVQDPATAQFGGMPQSALATGMVDYSLDIAEMPDLLLRYIHHPYISANRTTVPGMPSRPTIWPP